MKLLRIKLENINIFTEGLEIDFTAVDRIMNEDSVTKINDKLSCQNVIALTGLNASGKTSALRLIVNIVGLLVKSTSLNSNTQFKLYPALREGSIIQVDFFTGNKLYRLESLIEKSNRNRMEEDEQSFFFSEEIIYSKKLSSLKKKSDVFEYRQDNVLIKRSQLEKRNELSLLANDISIIAYVTKNKSIFIEDMIDPILNQIHEGIGSIDDSILNLFDNSILDTYKKDGSLNIKGAEEEANEDSVLIRGDNLTSILSSGTIKGIQLFNKLINTLKYGGYLVIDEIEQHMNKKLVYFILQLFLDDDINKNGACLIFTTHYPEILDMLDRKDNIYLLIKKKGICQMLRYSDFVSRNDIKKSDIVLSNYINGTAPRYEDVLRVRNYLSKQLERSK